ncbi:energy transducer TonB [Poseidonibacter lekithochrous]|uniref:energy transducer TonB n=1 Tax=Poseidonibacter TaxID=2321187 RepID=UPI001C0A1BD8|nr:MULTISPECIES: energy transducer TonB [Poseidonibacter]MBU3014745.1 energy transducer TonB [Poseidonibacter lekithochrous]MDO6828043.1 energy transducer TonB [Poseidonibacter sp. 1_MG-2023]
MMRYLNSFLITFFIYTSVIIAFITIFADDKIIIKKEKNLPQTISLRHVELMPVPKFEKKEELKKEEPKRVEAKKIEKKKVIKKKVVKKIEKKKPKKKKDIKKKIVRKIEKKKVEKTVVKKEVLKETIITKPTIIANPSIQKPIKQKVINEEKDVEQDYLDKYLRLIRNQIKQNVHYPKSAKRLRIQGIVNVKFTLRSNGKVDNIVILSGHSRLKKSTINAVKDAASSFPKIKKDITIQLPIEYKLI